MVERSRGLGESGMHGAVVRSCGRVPRGRWQAAIIGEVRGAGFHLPHAGLAGRLRRLERVQRETAMQMEGHRLYLTEDFHESARAFAEKRKPKGFVGR
jgi:hypothetical protein